MIRKATQNDLPKLEELYFLLFEQMANYEPYYRKATHQDQHFLRSVIAEENNFAAFVYDLDKDVKGFAIVQMQETLPYNCFVPLKYAYLIDIVVELGMRRKGIGKALINQVKIWAKENKADYLELQALMKNKDAAALYLREGFEIFSQSMRVRID